MKPPKCRLCGHEHWLNEAHIFDTDAVQDSAGAGAEHGAARPDAGGGDIPYGHEPNAAVIPNGSAAQRTKRWRQEHPEQHREYMRDYMRRRRGRG